MMANDKDTDTNLEAKVLLEENERLREEIKSLLCSNTSALPVYQSISSCSTSISKVSKDVTILKEWKNTSKPDESQSKTQTCCLDNGNFNITDPNCFVARSITFSRGKEEKLLKASSENDEADEQSCRIIGEIAFQLDRRILQVVFTPRKRMYGFTVRNIEEKIDEYTTDIVKGTVDVEKRNMLRSKHEAMMNMLRYTAGYNPTYHPIFAEMLVNAFGVLHNKTKDMRLKAELSEEKIKSVILETMGPEYTYDAMILLNSLIELSKLDGKPLFMGQ